MVFLGFFVVIISNTSFAATYDEWNLAKLQSGFAKGVASPMPWAGYWWPYRKNGVANSSYDSNSKSPLDKLDLAQGNGYWAAAWEYSSHGAGRSSDSWWGHCNGWATAAIMESEPRTSKVANGITFEVRDRKGVLSEYWLESGTDFIGTRVNNPYDTSSDAFWDVTPAQFHLVMTNIVGKNKRSVIIDRYTGSQVWNQPVVAYEIAPVLPEDYLGPDSQYQNLYRVNLTATLWWAEDNVKPDDITPPFEWKKVQGFNSRVLKYELWLDGPVKFDMAGKIVESGDIVITQNGYGGRWKNGANVPNLINSHPDFIWIPLSYAPSSGYKNPRLDDEWVSANISK